MRRLLQQVLLMHWLPWAVLVVSVAETRGQPVATASLPRQFSWQASGPLISARDVGGNAWHAIKDPTFVWHAGRWHLFATVRGKPRSHAIVYLSFADWDAADQAQQTILPNHDGFFCAPQVFYFTPHQKWYLICQASSPDWRPEYGPAFSTSTNIADVVSWTPLRPMVDADFPVPAAWLDFWVICDAELAHLFYTSLDGKMWRCATPLAQFPHGWSPPVLALEGDVFEASHTYRLRGVGEPKFLTLIEAQHEHGGRYYKAYGADRLEGPWQPWNASRDLNFASLNNVTQPAERWTDSISHGELVRATSDQTLEVDASQISFVFQGVLESQRLGKPYGDIPWRLGRLSLSAKSADHRELGDR